MLTMADVTKEPERRYLRLSEFEFNIVCRAAIEHQAADEVSCLKIRGEDHALLDDEVPVLSIPQELFALRAGTEITDFGFIKEPKGPFVPFIPEVCIMAGIMDNEKVAILTIVEFIVAQSGDADSRVTLTSVRKLYTRSNVKDDGLLVQFRPSHGELQPVVPAYLRPRFLTFVMIPFWPTATLASVACTPP